MRGIFDNLNAFTPFFDEKVVVECVRESRHFRKTCSACVIDEGYEDVFVDDVTTGSRIRKISVFIPMTGDLAWLDRSNPPQVGDLVTISHGVVFAVSSVRESGQDFFILEARQK